MLLQLVEWCRGKGYLYRLCLHLTLLCHQSKGDVITKGCYRLQWIIQEGRKLRENEMHRYGELIVKILPMSMSINFKVKQWTTSKCTGW
ncbi:hypothetical protein ACB092_01G384400 [Castanea dentata]